MIGGEFLLPARRLFRSTRRFCNDWRAIAAGMISEMLVCVANNRTIRGWALVAFGANTHRPTIVCIPEDAIPAMPGPAWLVFARDTDIAPAPRLLAPPRASDATTTD